MQIPADRLTRASPESVGVDSDRLARALDLTGGWVADGVVPGAGVIVARRGRIIGERYTGVTREGGSQAIGPETLFSLASVTKPFTATAVMLLVEQGALSLSERVQQWLPALKAEGTADITIRHLITHTAGFAQAVPAWAEAGGSSWHDWPSLLAALIKEQPNYAPGTRVSYSNVGYGLLGGLIEAASAMSYLDFMRTRLFEPLGLKETFIGPATLAPEVVARSAIVAGTARPGSEREEFNSTYYRAMGYPFSGLVANLRDLVTFAQVFLEQGRNPVTGAHFLSPITAQAMIRNQTGDLPGGFDPTLVWPHCPWGYGWEIKGDKQPHWLGEMLGPRTFLHIGSSGTMLWGDPDTGLVCAAAANRTGGWSQPYWWRFTNAVVTSVME